MIRKLLTATAAVAAVLAFAPAANAGTPATVVVGGDSSNTDHDADFLLKGVVEVTMGDLSLSCSDVGGTGVIHGGTIQNPWMEVTNAHFDECDGPGGNLMNITLNCPLEISDTATTSVTSAMTDVKDIELNVPPGCLHAEDIFGGFLCSLDITGTVDGTFTETPKTVGGVSYQDLALVTSHLQAANVSGCFGQVSNGTPIGFTLIFNVLSADGLVNQIP